MRVVSLLAAIGNGLLIFKILHLRFSTNWSLIGLLIWATSFGGIYYSVLARGYGLQLFFILMSFLFTLLILENEGSPNSNEWKLWAGLVISCALGFFTIPTFLFPFSFIVALLLMTWWKRSKKTALLKVIPLVLVVVFLSMMLYMPILKLAGLKSLVGHDWIKERSFSNLSNEDILTFLRRLLAYIGPVQIVLLALVFIIRDELQMKEWRGYLALFFLMPILIIVVTGTLPYARTFVYLSFFSAAFIVFRLSSVSGKLKILVNGTPLLLLTSLLYSGYYMISPTKPSPSTVGSAIRQKCLSLPDCKIIYAGSENANATMIDFYSWLDGYGPEVIFLPQENLLPEFAQLNGRYLLGTREYDVHCAMVVQERDIVVYDCLKHKKDN